MKKTGHVAKGHTSKHVGTAKHHALTAKHHPKHHHLSAKGLKEVRADRARAKAKHPHHAKGLALGDELPVCTIEALAMSLRLAGQPVSEDEVEWLWELAGGRELEISEALEAAARFGLAGCRPVFAPAFPAHLPGLILGVEQPGPHAVLATADGWWSWGELWSPWTTAIDEAWAVSWE